MNKTLITGAAGFIGFHLARRLLAQGDQVCAIDNMNDYYDINLKKDRLKLLEGQKNFTFIKADIADRTPNGGQISNLSPCQRKIRYCRQSGRAAWRAILFNKSLHLFRKSSKRALTSCRALFMMRARI